MKTKDMDYKYIEQLLDRYFACQTTLEEETILRAFFAQANVPAQLAKYKAIFAYQRTEQAADTLGADFDTRVLAAIGAASADEDTVKARPVTMRRRTFPLFKAAAIVAIAITIGNAAQMSFDQQPAPFRPVQPNATTIQAAAVRGDSATADTTRRSSMLPEAQQPLNRE